MPTAGFVLAGGSSTRMGRDKAMLPWHGKPLIEHVATQVEQVVGTVVLVGAPVRYRNLRFAAIADCRPGLGPLGGLESALASEQARDWNLVLSCDLPDIGVELLRSLAASPVGLCRAVRDSTGRLHPLCAAYHRDCLPAVQQRLNAGRFRMSELLQELNAQTVDWPHAIYNVNTPEEWAVCQSW